MKTSKLLVVLFVAVVMAVPAFPVSKEIIQLQTQVQALQDQMTQMRQSFDERMGVMKNLIEQSTDNVNKVVSSVNDLNQSLQKTHTDTGARADQLSGQIQALNDSVDELKARMAKLSQQLDAIQNAQQNINQPATGQPAQPGQPGQPAPGPEGATNQAPPADVLYNNALRDYNSGNFDLASQEFGDYLKYYQNTDLAGNAQFYLGDILYRQGNYQGAVKAYDTVIEQYPGGNKAAAAQLKKGYALLQLGQRQAGVRELNALITRYPRSIEAQQAKDRLKKLGAASAKTPPRGE
ncbi:MAG TPA: tetratricopeptide repeat protein [Terriglobales bacterium]|nr:tetratricopeptide repeat protein [Terriglobales bacterium]